MAACLLLLFIVRLSLFGVIKLFMSVEALVQTNVVAVDNAERNAVEHTRFRLRKFNDMNNC